MKSEGRVVLAADAEVGRHDRDVQAFVRARGRWSVHGGDADLAPAWVHEVLAVLGACEPECERASWVDRRRRPEQVLADRPEAPGRRAIEALHALPERRAVGGLMGEVAVLRHLRRVRAGRGGELRVQAELREAMLRAEGVDVD